MWEEPKCQWCVNICSGLLVLEGGRGLILPCYKEICKVKESIHKTQILHGYTSNEVSKVVKFTIRKFNGGCQGQTDNSELPVQWV